MMPIKLSDIEILSIKGFDYCCIISLISKNDAINLMQNADLTEKSGTLKVYLKFEKTIIKFKMEKSLQISTIIKYRKKVLNVFAY